MFLTACFLVVIFLCIFVLNCFYFKFSFSFKLITRLQSNSDINRASDPKDGQICQIGVNIGQKVAKYTKTSKTDISPPEESLIM